MRDRADIRAVAMEMEECQMQARVLYSKKFPAVMRGAGLAQNINFGKKVIVAGVYPKKTETVKSLLQGCLQCMTALGASAVLCLVGSRPPDEDVEAPSMLRGTHEMSAYSCFESRCYVTIWCKKASTAKDIVAQLAKDAASAMSNPTLQSKDLQRKNPYISLRLEEPSPNEKEDGKEQPSPDEKKEGKEQQLKDAVAKLRGAAKSDKTRYVDASRKALKVCLAMPEPTSKSVILSVTPEGKIGCVSMLEALGYSSKSVNLSLQSLAGQQSMIASAPHAVVAATMLNAAAKFL